MYADGTDLCGSGFVHVLTLLTTNRGTTSDQIFFLSRRSRFPLPTLTEGKEKAESFCPDDSESTAQQGKEADKDERLANGTKESGFWFGVDVLVSLACLFRSQNRPGRMGANVASSWRATGWCFAVIVSANGQERWMLKPRDSTRPQCG